MASGLETQPPNTSSVCSSETGSGLWERWGRGTMGRCLCWDVPVPQHDALEQSPSAGVRAAALCPPERRDECALLAMGVVGFSTLSLPDSGYYPEYSQDLYNSVPHFSCFSTSSAGPLWLLCAAGLWSSTCPPRPRVSGAEPSSHRAPALCPAKNPPAELGGNRGRSCMVPQLVLHQEQHLGGQDLF